MYYEGYKRAEDDIKSYGIEYAIEHLKYRAKIPGLDESFTTGYGLAILDYNVKKGE